MDHRWLKHTKDKSKTKESIANSKYTLDLLKDILNKELQELDVDKKEDYNIPNWSYYQADKIGYKRAIKSFIKLLTINKD